MLGREKGGRVLACALAARPPEWHGQVPRLHGYSLIEAMISLAIIAVALTAGIPSFASWLQNLQIRTAAESIKNGLQLAQSEALRRNTPVRFQFTSTIDNSCALSMTDANWVVNVGDSTNDPSGQCAASPEAAPANIVRSSSVKEGASNAVLAAPQSMVIFNGYGKAINVAGSINIDVTNPKGGACATAGGPMTCMRIVVSSAGQVRMCNPNIAAGTPQGC